MILPTDHVLEILPKNHWFKKYVLIAQHRNSVATNEKTLCRWDGESLAQTECANAKTRAREWNHQKRTPCMTFYRTHPSSRSCRKTKGKNCSNIAVREAMKTTCKAFKTYNREEKNVLWEIRHRFWWERCQIKNICLKMTINHEF